jgi:formate/nitrite transporter FocA (FNT family)
MEREMNEPAKAHEESARERDTDKPLEPSERQKARDEESLNAKITHEVVRIEGEKELDRTTSALWWAALAGGLSMGFSLVAEGLLRAHVADAHWRPLITKLGYPVGFIIITLASQQLFTENTITPIVPLLRRKTRAMLRNVARLWAVVFVGNMIGVIVFAWILGRTEMFEPHVRQAFEDIGLEAIKPAFVVTFIRAIFAGWLIALMVWMLPAASTSKVAVIAIMTYIVGVGHLAHVIAGSAAVLVLVATGIIGWATFLGEFMLPALVGNIVGGLVFVAALNHAQVASDKS